MAHELELVNGRIEAAFALQPAWHGLGKVLDYVPNSEQMIVAAGLDWTMSLRETMDADGHKTGEYGIFRDDIHACFGSVTERYQLVQNRPAFDWCDSLLMDGSVRYESAGVINKGKTVWVLARLPEVDTIVPGDTINRYVLFSNKNDGKGRLHFHTTATRVVCNNTLRLAIAGNTGIRHMGDMNEKLETARNLIAASNAAFTQHADIARTLANRRYTADDATQYVEAIFPAPVDADGARLTKGNAFTRWENKSDAIIANRSNERNGFDAIRGTWWSLYNSVTEFVDHQATFKKTVNSSAEENRFLSVLEGPGADVKTKAFDLALSMSK